MHSETSDSRLSEDDLRAAMRDWTTELPHAPGRAVAVHQRVRRHRARVAAGSAIAAVTAVALVVVGVGALGSAHRTTVVPPVKNPTTAAQFPVVYQGGTVRGQVAGTGAAERSTTLVWPAHDTVRVVYRCTGRPGSADTASIAVQVPGYDSLTTFCVGTQVQTLDLAGSMLANIPAGATVTMTVTTSGSVVGPWSLAVIDLDPHWLDTASPAKTFDGRKLLTFLRGGAIGGSSGSFVVTTSEVDADIVLECSESGTLGLLINGNFVASTQCPSQTWSRSLVYMPPGSLATYGWVPGARVTLSMNWSGTDDPYAGILVYGK
jgi:hypothetical protein